MNTKKNMLLIAIIMVLATITTLGYAALSQDLSITGDINFNKKTASAQPHDSSSLAQALEGQSKTSDKMIGNTGLYYDQTSDHNLRYAGSDVYNYATFNGETAGWRIIGWFNNVDDGTGNKETRIKLIRADSIGNYSWDSSDSDVNNGEGVNDWTQAKLMQLLNDGYSSLGENNSLYWNRSNGVCYISGDLFGMSCKFSGWDNLTMSSTIPGLNDEAKSMIGNAVWYLGDSTNSTSKEVYNAERTATIENGHAGTWTGKVALMNKSDYGYASSACRSGTDAFLEYQDSNCKSSDWLYGLNKDEHLLNPNIGRTNEVSVLLNEGNLTTGAASGARAIRPVVYLNSDVGILSGSGTQQDPYVLGKLPICKRATTLHTAKCERQGYGCGNNGYSLNATVTFGNTTTTPSQLNAGDAFDCDVNGDGTYDSETERFYYVSGLNGDSTSKYAVLVYYANVSGGVPVSDNTGYHYNSTQSNINGPVTGYQQLPSTTQWPNVSLSNQTRQIYAENGSTSTTGGTIDKFTYTNKAARLLASKELEQACPISYAYNNGDLDNCEYLMENGFYTNTSTGESWWLETPQSFNGTRIWVMNGGYRSVNNFDTNTNLGIRPTIEVLKTDIDY